MRANLVIGSGWTCSVGKEKYGRSVFPSSEKVQYNLIFDFNGLTEVTHSSGKYTAISKPPLKGRVMFLNPFSGVRRYPRRSLYNTAKEPVLSTITTAPRLSRGWIILRVGSASGVQTTKHQRFLDPISTSKEGA